MDHTYGLHSDYLDDIIITLEHLESSDEVRKREGKASSRLSHLRSEMQKLFETTIHLGWKVCQISTLISGGELILMEILLISQIN